jgi:hypothetical protein
LQAVEGAVESTEKRVIEVRWLPPDPNDHSRYHGDLSDERPVIDVEPGGKAG